MIYHTPSIFKFLQIHFWSGTYRHIRKLFDILSNLNVIFFSVSRERGRERGKKEKKKKGRKLPKINDMFKISLISL